MAETYADDLPATPPCHAMQEAASEENSYNCKQQGLLLNVLVVAVHQGAWQQLEARMRAALQLLPSLADKA